MFCTIYVVAKARNPLGSCLETSLSFFFVPAVLFFRRVVSKCLDEWTWERWQGSWP